MRGTPIVAGAAQGAALVSDEPLSFWGGYDQQTSEIIDRRHPLSGQRAAGCVLALPCTRGSSTTTSVLLEAVRAGQAPAAIVTDSVDRFLALASIVAEEMYGQPIPLVTVSAADFATLQSGQWIEVQPDGSLIVTEQPHAHSHS
jgi:predicted aconitase with swiveling domain